VNRFDLRRALEGGKDSAVGGIPLDSDKVPLQIAARHVRNLLLLAGGRIDVPDLIEDEERDIKPVFAIRGDSLRHPRHIAHVVECNDSPSSTTRYALRGRLPGGCENGQYKNADNRVRPISPLLRSFRFLQCYIHP
jgi:hypothetical protein